MQKFIELTRMHLDHLMFNNELKKQRKDEMVKMPWRYQGKKWVIYEGYSSTVL